MPICFIIFIVFVIWFRVKLHQGSKSDMDEKNRAFWQREAEANFCRKQDISGLDYLQPSADELPFSAQPEGEEAALQQAVADCLDLRMLNLSGYTNTDLKELYGAANLDALSEYDQNYTRFICALSEWGNYLYEKNDVQRARTVLEYALQNGSDISAVYLNLAKIYAANHTPAKIDDLIDAVAQSQSLIKDSIIHKLRVCKLDA